VTLAQIYIAENEKEKARQALVHAQAFLYANPDDTSVKNEIKRLAKLLGDEKLADRTPPIDTFREVGFAELTSSTSSVERTVELRERAALFMLEEEDGQPVVASARIVRAVSEEDGPHYAVEYVLARNGSWSSGSTGNAAVNGEWSAMTSTAIENLRVLIEAEKTGPNRFSIRFSRQ
jgi:hypothetical protein